MKKYNLFLELCAVLSAVIFSACGNKGTRTVIYTEPLPYLTVMTQTTTTAPADTYSEYMATYSTTESSTANYFAAPGLGGIAADTAVVNPHASAVTTAPPTDTAVTLPEMDTVFTPVTKAYSETDETSTVSSESEASAAESVGTSMPESTEASIAESTGTSMTSVAETRTTFPSHSIQIPAPDTASPHAVQADTAPTKYSGTSDDSGTETNTSNGGTE